MRSDERQQSGHQTFVLPSSFTVKAPHFQCQHCISRASRKEAETSLVFQMSTTIRQLVAYRIVGQSKETEIRKTD